MENVVQPALNINYSFFCFLESELEADISFLSVLVLFKDLLL